MEVGGLGNSVMFETRFLSNQESLERLAASDVIVYPYQRSRESSSAAVRMGLASRRPALCSPLPVFADVADVVQFLPGIGPEDIRDGLLSFLADRQEQDRLALRQEAWLERNNWPSVAGLLQQILAEPQVGEAEMDRKDAVGPFVATLVAEREAADQAMRDLQEQFAWLKQRWDGIEADRTRLAAELTARTAEKVGLEGALATANGALAAASQQIADLERSNQHWSALAESREREVQAVYRSSSWRLTKPLRDLVLLYRRLSSRSGGGGGRHVVPGSPTGADDLSATALSQREAAVYADLRQAIEKKKP